MSNANRSAEERRLRDEQLRASILTHARVAGNRSDDGWVFGSQVAIAARDDKHVAVDDTEHAERLIADLVQCGLLVEKPNEIPGPGTPDLRHRFLKLSHMGRQLWLQQIPPVPGVADGRLR